MSRVKHIAAAALAIATIGCGNGIQEVQVLPAPSTLQVVADSTTRLVSFAAIATDTAMVKIRVATTVHSLPDARALVLNARRATATASAHASAAIRQGDWLRNILVEDRDERGAEYDRYWKLGRAKLEAASSLSGQALAVADSALSCTDQSCATQRARQMQSHVEAAAGATREAESVVRVAMVHAKE